MPTTPPIVSCPFTTVKGRLFVEVPLERADLIQDRLTQAGIPATVCLDPYERADIEVPADADRARVLQVLRECSGYQAA